MKEIDDRRIETITAVIEPKVIKKLFKETAKFTDELNEDALSGKLYGMTFRTWKEFVERLGITYAESGYSHQKQKEIISSFVDFDTVDGNIRLNKIKNQAEILAEKSGVKNFINVIRTLSKLAEKQGTIYSTSVLSNEIGFYKKDFINNNFLASSEDIVDFREKYKEVIQSCCQVYRRASYDEEVNIELKNCLLNVADWLNSYIYKSSLKQLKDIMSFCEEIGLFKFEEGYLAIETTKVSSSTKNKANLEIGGGKVRAATVSEINDYLKIRETALKNLHCSNIREVYIKHLNNNYYNEVRKLLFYANGLFDMRSGYIIKKDNLNLIKQFEDLEPNELTYVADTVAEGIKDFNMEYCRTLARNYFPLTKQIEIPFEQMISIVAFYYLCDKWILLTDDEVKTILRIN